VPKPLEGFAEDKVTEGALDFSRVLGLSRSADKVRVFLDLPTKNK